MSLLLAPLYMRGQESAGDQEWRQFLAWVKRAPAKAFGHAREAFAAYQQHLISSGRSAADAESVVARVQQRSVNSPEFQGVIFDRIYSLNLGNIQTIPNAFLVETVRTLKPGKALDVGMERAVTRSFWHNRAGT
jgi:hypothetical protein